jgi:hypothetical protein
MDAEDFGTQIVEMFTNAKWRENFNCRVFSFWDVLRGMKFS